METNNTTINADALFKKISVLIEESRKKVATAVNIAEVYTKYEIGRYIVEDEQYGKHKAEYGKQVIIKLSERLSVQFGAGWSEDTLSNCRKFYKTYSRTHSSQTLHEKYRVNTNDTNFLNTVSEIQNDLEHPHKFVLSWSHYLVLMRIKDENARNFYEIESRKQNWSVRWLQRQVSSSLYERIALSKNKEEVMRLAKEGQAVEKPADIIKNPITLEFLGLKPEAAYSETRLESAIISKMQSFLLELGK